MTRENKLALIIGFGLILVVGILVSDHFSAASRQETADLTVERRGDQDFARLDDRDFLTPVARDDDASSFLQPQEMLTNGAAAGHEPDPRADRSGTTRESPRANDPATLRTIRNPDLQALQPSNELPARHRWYTIKPGESLSSICRDQYGDTDLWRLLAEVNRDRISNPDIVPSRVTIRLPEKSEMLRLAAAGGVPREPTRAREDQSPPSRPDYREYTVKGGDTLSEIAQRFLGSSRKWHTIYDANRDVISDPDNVPKGTTLKIPTG